MGIEDFISGGQGQSDPIKLAESLLTPENIRLKTDLNISQIKVLFRLKWFEVVTDPTKKHETAMQLMNNYVIPYFLELMPSLKRLSRKEIVDIFSKMGDKMFSQERSMFGGPR